MRRVFRHETIARRLDVRTADRAPHEEDLAASMSGAQRDLNPIQVMSLQRAVGNATTQGILRHMQGPEAHVQRAGDPEGMMKEHHATNFTYHHIIPENKLHDLWHTLQEKGHTALIKTGLGSVVTRGTTQLQETATSNIKLDLRKEIGEETNAWDDSQFAAITAEAMAGASPEALAKKYFPGIENSDHKYNSSYNPIKTIFNKRFKILSSTTSAKVESTVKAEGSSFLADSDATEAASKMLMWMPGNIHRGPSKRFVPGDTGFDPDVDDGGKFFEDAAKQIIPDAQYQTLVKLNGKIDAYLAKPDDPAPLAELSAALTEMSKYSVTDYDVNNWREHEEGSGKKKKKAWSLKKKG